MNKKIEKQFNLSTAVLIVGSLVLLATVAVGACTTGEQRKVYTPSAITWDTQGGLVDIADHTLNADVCVEHDFVVLETIPVRLRACYVTTELKDEATGESERIHCAVGEINAMGTKGAGSMSSDKYKDRCAEAYGAWTFYPVDTGGAAE